MRLPSSSPRILNLEKRTDDILPLGAQATICATLSNRNFFCDSRPQSPTMVKQSLDERRDLDNNQIYTYQVRRRQQFTAYLEVQAVIIPSGYNVCMQMLALRTCP